MDPFIPRDAKRVRH